MHMTSGDLLVKRLRKAGIDAHVRDTGDGVKLVAAPAPGGEIRVAGGDRSPQHHVGWHAYFSGYDHNSGTIYNSGSSGYGDFNADTELLVHAIHRRVTNLPQIRNVVTDTLVAHGLMVHTVPDAAGRIRVTADEGVTAYIDTSDEGGMDRPVHEYSGLVAEFSDVSGGNGAHGPRHEELHRFPGGDCPDGASRLAVLLTLVTYGQRSPRPTFPGMTADEVAADEVAADGVAVFASADQRDGGVCVAVDTGDCASLPLEARLGGTEFAAALPAGDILVLALQNAGFRTRIEHTGGGCWIIVVPCRYGGQDGEMWISDPDARIHHPAHQHPGWLATWHPGGFDSDGDDLTVYESTNTDVLEDSLATVKSLQAMSLVVL